MAEIERIGISIEKTLLDKFDGLIEKQGYKNRSEAVRDLIRDRINQDKISDSKAETIAVVFLVYDHHSTKLSDNLIGLQHSHLVETISSMHIHLDKHDCLELIAVKGKKGKIEKLANKMISLKGVKGGKVNYIGI